MQNFLKGGRAREKFENNRANSLLTFFQQYEKKNKITAAFSFQSKQPKCLLWSKCAELDALHLPHPHPHSASRSLRGFPGIPQSAFPRQALLELGHRLREGEGGETERQRGRERGGPMGGRKREGVEK